ncbi:MAG TPA: hypothetical protein VFY29_04900 [Terriglobia bacterium]|nr:hypothetical protein [Terriglobia bacterium]
MATPSTETQFGRGFAVVVTILAVVVTVLAVMQNPASAGEEPPIELEARIILADRIGIDDLVRSSLSESKTPAMALPAIYTSSPDGPVKQPLPTVVVLPKDTDEIPNVTRYRRTTHTDDAAMFAFDRQIPVQIDKANTSTVVFLTHNYKLRIRPEIVDEGRIRLKVSLGNTFPDSTPILANHHLVPENVKLETVTLRTEVTAVVPDRGAVVIRGVGYAPPDAELQLWITPRITAAQAELQPTRRASR